MLWAAYEGTEPESEGVLQPAVPGRGPLWRHGRHQRNHPERACNLPATDKHFSTQPVLRQLGAPGDWPEEDLRVRCTVHVRYATLCL